MTRLSAISRAEWACSPTERRVRKRRAREQKNTGIYLLTFLRGVQHPQDAMMTHARQCDGVASQHVRHDLASLRLVQLVGDSLLKHEHGRLLSSVIHARITATRHTAYTK